MKQRLTRDTARLADELASLPALDREALVEQWMALYGTDPPRGVRNKFLMHAIARRMQENSFGGLKPATCRFLEKAAEDRSSKQPIPPIINIKAGTRLLREWHGVTYEVIVLENSVMCNGKYYRSLSQVARAITGVRWSGPLFFGLKRREVA